MTQKEIREALSVWPQLRGRAVMVHSALSSFGSPIEDGAMGVLSALFEVVGSQGTLILPTLSFSSVDESRPILDVRRTPSDCGLLTETFRRLPGVWRSHHVVSSAAAWGKDACEITAHHHDTPCGEFSPYRRLIEADGYVLFMGTDFSCNTLFHAAEEMVSPEYLRYASLRHACIIDETGQEHYENFRRYDCYQQGIYRYLEKMEPICKEAGVLLFNRVGASRWTLVRARENVYWCCKTLRENIDYLLTV